MIRPASQESNHQTFELSLIGKSHVPALAEIFKRILINAGVDINSLIECKTAKSICVAGYFNSLSQTKLLQKHLMTLGLRDVHLKVKVMQQRDWADAWKKNFRPFLLTRKLLVVPSWYRQNYPIGKKIPIFIDTALAFGTGLHETTRFMAKFIECNQGQFVNFLDVGTGTGILSIVAGRYGVPFIEAIDIDSGSVQVARKNFLRNGLPLIHIRTMDFNKFTPRKYDFVAANLISDDLIAMAKKLVGCVKTDKFLAISGISLSNLSRVQNVFKKFPLRCIRILKGKEWAAILFRRL